MGIGKSALLDASQVDRLGPIWLGLLFIAQSALGIIIVIDWGVLVGYTFER